MKLYLLTRLTELNYDQYAGWVISAKSHPSARRIANAESSREYERCDWMLVKDASCRLIADSTTEPEGVVLSDYNAG